jgi:hypothetical protein
VSFFLRLCRLLRWENLRDGRGTQWRILAIRSVMFRVFQDFNYKKKQDIFRFKRNLQTKLHCLVSRWLHRPGAAENVKLLGA